MSSSRTKRVASFAFPAVTILLLQACTYQPHPEAIKHAQQVLPTEQFVPKVTNTPEQIAIGLHASGLSSNQQAALGVFVSRWRENGGGPITLRAPVGSNAAVSRHMEDVAADYLVKLGAPRERLVIAGYPEAANPAAPLLISYERFEAQRPNCSGGWGDLTTTGSNIPYDHFGCATTANIAVQVANPRDLLTPAVETPADNSRREVVLGKYRQGLTTSSAKDVQANGKVSDVGGGN